jgi:hypothetical protein
VTEPTRHLAGPSSRPREIRVSFRERARATSIAVAILGIVWLTGAGVIASVQLESDCARACAGARVSSCRTEYVVCSSGEGEAATFELVRSSR